MVPLPPAGALLCCSLWVKKNVGQNNFCQKLWGVDNDHHVNHDHHVHLVHHVHNVHLVHHIQLVHHLHLVRLVLLEQVGTNIQCEEGHTICDTQTD